MNDYGKTPFSLLIIKQIFKYHKNKVKRITALINVHNYISMPKRLDLQFWCKFHSGHREPFLHLKKKNNILFWELFGHKTDQNLLGQTYLNVLSEEHHRLWCVRTQTHAHTVQSMVTDKITLLKRPPNISCY